MKLLVIAFSLFLVSTAFALQADLAQQVPTPSIRGKVLQEPDEQPIRKANVKLKGRTGPSAAQYSAITDSQGQFAIDDVQPGQYVVVVEHPGFVQSNTGRRLTTISVQPGAGKNDLIFHMLPSSVITGKIVDSAGDPMPRVNVLAIRSGSVVARQDSHDSRSGSTNDLGEFRISDLRPGRYKITANFPPQAPRPSDVKENNNGKDQSIYLTTHYPGVLDEDQAVAVEIQAGAEARISFGVLTGRAFRVSGTVTGIPSGGGMNILVLVPKGGRGEIAAQQHVGEGGQFEFANVLPGMYGARLEVVTFEGGRPGMQMLRLGQPIEVSNANVEGLRLQPEAAGQVRGKFRMDTTDQKVDWSQLTVHLLPFEEQGRELEWESVMMGLQTSSSVNSDGTFEMKNVPGGSYQLVVGAKSNTLRDYFTKSVNLGGRDVADSNFQVLPETFLEVVVSANGATVAGTVVDANGQPVANATVVNVPSVEHRSRPDLYQREMTDASGHFSLRGLNPGKYTILAFEELQQDVRQPEFLRTYETQGEIVQLEEGARKSVALKLIASDGEVQ